MVELDPCGVPASPGTPYVTPAMLIAAPTGIVWSSLGATVKPTPQQQIDEQINLCRRATSMIDGFCNQPLRATVDVETLWGPGDLRFQMWPSSGVARLLLSRSPVLQVTGGQVCATATFPPQFQPVQSAQFKIEKPIIGVYGTTAPGGSGDGGAAVLMAPGLVGWWFGRYAYQVQISYINGWPHGSLTASAAAGAITVQIDDCTGWGPPAGAPTGATGTIQDPSRQEVVTVVAASAASGPGTLTLSAPLGYDHAVGIMLTTLPQSVIQAAILFCVAQALTRGATASSIQTLPGRTTTTGKARVEDADERARCLVQPYKRII